MKIIPVSKKAASVERVVDIVAETEVLYRNQDTSEDCMNCVPGVLTTGISPKDLVRDGIRIHTMTI